MTGYKDTDAKKGTTLIRRHPSAPHLCQLCALTKHVQAIVDRCRTSGPAGSKSLQVIIAPLAMWLPR